MAQFSPPPPDRAAGRGQHRHRAALAGGHGAHPPGPGRRRPRDHARRFVTVYTPGGTVRARYTPTGSETAFTLGPILARSSRCRAACWSSTGWT